MVCYASTRKSYSCQQELTVDYGRCYLRHYASGVHKPVREASRGPKTLACEPAEQLSASQLSQPRFPSLPGWFNPRRQPISRPLFERDTRTGAVSVCADDPLLVSARRAALGLPTPPLPLVVADTPKRVRTDVHSTEARAGSDSTSSTTSDVESTTEVVPSTPNAAGARKHAANAVTPAAKPRAKGSAEGKAAAPKRRRTDGVEEVMPHGSSRLTFVAKRPRRAAA